MSEIGQRILIFGNAGSGKSTLARKLGELLELPVVHLDKVYWLPNWENRDDESMKDRVEALANTESWVMDGNYLKFSDLRIERADTILFFKLRRLLCVRRVLSRARKQKGKTRADMAEGCVEKIDREFLKYVWNYPKKYEYRVEIILRNNPEKKQFIFKKPGDVEKFLEDIEKSKQKKAE